MEESRLNLKTELEKYDDIKCVMDDIEVVEEMLKFDSFDKEKVQEIESRYSIETRFLLEFENSDKIAFSINFETPILELLLNLQKRLYIIAVYKILKMQGKEVPNDIVTVDFSRLLEFIK